MTKKRTFSLERISQYSILLLTFLTVLLTAMGVYYTMRSFQKVPLHVVVLGWWKVKQFKAFAYSICLSRAGVFENAAYRSRDWEESL